MRPIVNTRNKDATLHAAEALTLESINCQKALYQGGLKTNAEQNDYESK
jgi:hypothetical protein